jgi:phospholipid-translocating ATPase
MHYNAVAVTDKCSQNAMVFRQCSIAGRLYTGDPPDDGSFAEDKPLEAKTLRNASSSSDATSSTTPPEKADPTSAEDKVPNTMTSPKVKLSASVLAHFRDRALTADIARSADSDADAAFSRSLNGFFAVLALCHTVIATVDPLTHVLEFKAQSPDEAALVQAAADAGFIFRGRDREILRMQTPFSENVEEYELLNVLDFTSARKRMSIVVRKLDQNDRRLFLLTKGADNVIFERLRKDENDEIKVTTEKHLEDFANEGVSS